MTRQGRAGPAPRLRAGLLHLAAWTALAFLSAGQTLLTYLATGNEVQIRPVLLVSLALWYSWGALSPVIWWAARELPLHGRGWPLRALAHLGINLVLGVVAAAGYRVLRTAAGIPPRGDWTVAIASGLNTALLVYWGLVAAAHALAYRRRTEERRRAALELDRQLAQARLDALRAQIQPHFLFNTLNAIASQVRQDPRGAEDMLGEMGELLRTGLHSSPAHEIPLVEELRLVERYIAIQHVRFEGRMRVERDIDERALGALVPVLLLQPLVENAIEHGIARRLAGGTLRIRARVLPEGDPARAGAEVLIEVVDRCDRPDAGRAEERQEAEGAKGAVVDPATWGIGLRNTRARLEQLYGDPDALRLEPDDGGVTASVRIPFRAAATGRGA